MSQMSVLMAITQLRVSSPARSVQSIGPVRTNNKYTLIKSTVANSEVCGDPLPVKPAAHRLTPATTSSWDKPHRLRVPQALGLPVLPCSAMSVHPAMLVHPQSSHRLKNVSWALMPSTSIKQLAILARLDTTAMASKEVRVPYSSIHLQGGASANLLHQATT